MRSVINEPIKPRPLIRNYFNPRLRGERERERALSAIRYYTGTGLFRAYSPSIYTRGVSTSIFQRDDFSFHEKFLRMDPYIGAFEFRYMMEDPRIYGIYGETIMENVILRKSRSLEDDVVGTNLHRSKILIKPRTVRY